MPMTTAKDSPNPFEPYQGEEVELAPVKAATHDDPQPISMIAIAGLMLIATLLAIIAWRYRSK